MALHGAEELRGSGAENGPGSIEDRPPRGGGSRATWQASGRLAHDGSQCRERYPEPMDLPREVEFVFEPQDEGGYHVYAPDLPGLHTQGDSLDEATENASEALALYVDGLRDEGRTFDMGIVRRRLPVSA